MVPYIPDSPASCEGYLAHVLKVQRKDEDESRIVHDLKHRNLPGCAVPVTWTSRNAGQSDSP